MTQTENLNRVQVRIGSAVLAFCEKRATRKRKPNFFHMEELTRYIQRRMGRRNVAPDSPSRILRSLRQAKKIDYCVISRAESLYWINPSTVGGATNAVVAS